MSKKTWKVLAAVVILVSAVSYLAYAAIQSGRTYYLSVDAFLADDNPSLDRSARVRLHGKVDSEGLQADSGGLRAQFTLRGQSKHMPVDYRGAIPDSFKSDIEVVVEGRLDGGGVFQADTLMTKCESKYMPESARAKAESAS